MIFAQRRAREAAIPDRHLLHFVVRGGLSSPPTLMAGSTLTQVPGLAGFSVQSAPHIPLEQLIAEIPNAWRYRFVSVGAASALANAGFELVWPTPGRGGYHATVRTPHKLSLHDAVRVSALFERRPNALYSPGGS